MKKKIGNLYGKPVVVGDGNLITPNEISIKTGDTVTAPKKDGLDYIKSVVGPLLGSGVGMNSAPDEAGIEFGKCLYKCLKEDYRCIILPGKENIIPDHARIYINGHVPFHSGDTISGIAELNIFYGKINGMWTCFKWYYTYEIANDCSYVSVFPIEAESLPGGGAPV